MTNTKLIDDDSIYAVAKLIIGECYAEPKVCKKCYEYKDIEYEYEEANLMKCKVDEYGDADFDTAEHIDSLDNSFSETRYYCGTCGSDHIYHIVGVDDLLDFLETYPFAECEEELERHKRAIKLMSMTK